MSKIVEPCGHELDDCTCYRSDWGPELMEDLMYSREGQNYREDWDDAVGEMNKILEENHD